ncbi:hypothetical protein DZC31_22890 [Stenotrophomonas rhizophila]|nr:hypothetical protein DZC31_22890 [Stenotrophomonas rhizophila]
MVRLHVFGDLGAALQPFRDTRPLLQGNAISCRSGLVSRKGRKAAPALHQVRYSALIFTYSWDRSVVQMVSLHWPRPSSIRMVISS